MSIHQINPVRRAQAQHLLLDDYDPDEIITRATNDNDHSSNLRVHVPPAISTQMRHIITSPEWPEIRSLQDVVRDALYHRLHWYSERGDRLDAEETVEVRKLMAMERAAARISREIDVMDRFQELVDQCRTLVGLAQQSGGRRAARAALDSAENEADGFDEQMKENFLGVLGDLRRQLV